MDMEYARVVWTIADVHSRREDLGLEPWTDSQAEGFLLRAEKQMQDDMIERGWDSMTTLFDTMA